MYRLRRLSILLSFLMQASLPAIHHGESPGQDTHQGLGLHQVSLWLSSSADTQHVQPGDVIEWAIRAEVTGPNRGLALIAVDLIQDPDNPELIDLPAGSGAPPGMEMFDRPQGFTNPGPSPDVSGYGGTPVRMPGEAGDLLQIGGAQNTTGVPGFCLGPEMNICMGQSVQVVEDVGRQTGGQLIATGSFPAPAAPGSYVFAMASPRALTLLKANRAPVASHLRVAGVHLAEPAFSINVVEPAALGQVPPPVPRRGLAARHGAGAVRPPEGVAITYTHVRFQWPVHGAIQSYQLAIVPDLGEPDPFTANPEQVMEHTVDSHIPRLEVTSGLSFGTSYAWKVGPSTAGPAAQIHRFRVKPLPVFIPLIMVSHPDPGPVQPGLTLFNISNRAELPAFPGGLAVAVDESGQVVYFLSKPDVPGAIRYLELYPSGRLLMLRGQSPEEGLGQVVVEETLDGRVAWRSPQGRGYVPHHDTDVLPNGDVLLLLYDDLHLPEDGFARRRGDRIVVLDRQSGEEVWSWRTYGNYSLDDGFPDIRRWTHGNAAHYNQADNSVYFSSRHFSRITRIDFDTGDIIYNMGEFTASGDTDFGDGFLSFQHAPELQSDGNMLVYDNGNTRMPQRSRVIEIAFDNPELPTTADIVWEAPILDETLQFVFTGFVGDADRLPNGNTLAGAGARSTILELTDDLRVVWKLQLEPWDSFVIYRAERIPSLFVDTPGDRDGDWDLDLADLAGLQLALGQPGHSPLVYPDTLSDINGDGGLDDSDMIGFFPWMTGPLE